eukprot:TRINITY_DN16061_c0_g1_i1.p4 TRINITY_DN16061_c0_g1~~TRINITY_DN16061_c0_g1_i1.p4  ORF type:complete len:111 (-),score=12.23 TRINITY_DN16061_c0_g1_i1:1411-1743(-)
MLEVIRHLIEVIFTPTALSLLLDLCNMVLSASFLGFSTGVSSFIKVSEGTYSLVLRFVIPGGAILGTILALFMVLATLTKQIDYIGRRPTILLGNFYFLLTLLLVLFSHS